MLGHPAIDVRMPDMLSVTIEHQRFGPVRPTSPDARRLYSPKIHLRQFGCSVIWNTMMSLPCGDRRKMHDGLPNRRKPLAPGLRAMGRRRKRNRSEPACDQHKSPAVLRHPVVRRDNDLVRMPVPKLRQQGEKARNGPSLASTDCKPGTFSRNTYSGRNERTKR